MSGETTTAPKQTAAVDVFACLHLKIRDPRRDKARGFAATGRSRKGAPSS